MLRFCAAYIRDLTVIKGIQHIWWFWQTAKITREGIVIVTPFHSLVINSWVNSLTHWIRMYNGIPLPKLIVRWDLESKLRWHFIQITIIFVQQIAFRNTVCRMAGIFVSVDSLSTTPKSTVQPPPTWRVLGSSGMGQRWWGNTAKNQGQRNHPYEIRMLPQYFPWVNI